MLSVIVAFFIEPKRGFKRAQEEREDLASAAL
jgi:hypothetical protein